MAWKGYCIAYTSSLQPVSSGPSAYFRVIPGTREILMLERRSEPRPARLQGPVLYKTVFNNKTVLYYTKTVPHSAALLQELHIFRQTLNLLSFTVLLKACCVCCVLLGVVCETIRHCTWRNNDIAKRTPANKPITRQNIIWRQAHPWWTSVLLPGLLTVTNIRCGNMIHLHTKRLKKRTSNSSRLGLQECLLVSKTLVLNILWLCGAHSSLRSW